MLVLVTLSDGQEAAINTDHVRSIWRNDGGYTRVTFADGSQVLTRQGPRDIAGAEMKLLSLRAQGAM